MTNYNYPFIIEFPKIGQSSLGYISIAEKITYHLFLKEFIGPITLRKKLKEEDTLIMIYIKYWLLFQVA